MGSGADVRISTIVPRTSNSATHDQLQPPPNSGKYQYPHPSDRFPHLHGREAAPVDEGEVADGAALLLLTPAEAATESAGTTVMPLGLSGAGVELAGGRVRWSWELGAPKGNPEEPHIATKPYCHRPAFIEHEHATTVDEGAVLQACGWICRGGDAEEGGP
ncbi:hypothetical protein C8R45DRAFT_1078553 [Mycena sanguinolenta]|nr:hypothetical protein C8R45DRAFT_1078553 [Mycena sanguinolenta]